MKNYLVIILSSIISVLFILLTAWIAFSETQSIAFEFSFLFHLIPFGIGYGGGDSIFIYIYYLLLWVGLSLLFSPYFKAFDLSENKKKFLTFSIIPLLLIMFIVVYVDFSNNMEREEKISQNLKKNKADFNHLKTGDLLFQRVSKSSILPDSMNSDRSSYYNIGIVFIDGQNYTLLENINQVKYISIRTWVDNGNNQYYEAKRLKKSDSLFTSKGIQKLNREARNNIMKQYEDSANWSDEKMYNAELIWKIYKRSLDVELGKLDTIKVNSVLEYKITSEKIFTSENLVPVKKE